MFLVTTLDGVLFPGSGDDAVRLSDGPQGAFEFKFEAQRFPTTEIDQALLQEAHLNSRSPCSTFDGTLLVS